MEGDPIVKFDLTVYARLASPDSASASLCSPANLRSAHESTVPPGHFVPAGVRLDLVNIFIASVAYPDIGRSLGASVATLAWIGNTYLLGLTLVIPLSVWLASRLGERRLMLLALAGFASASLGCGLAGSAATLIVWRLCQGLAGGLLIPSARPWPIGMSRRRHGPA